MLYQLSIKNYALIDSLELEFGPGLSIITGETGAGKSIMLGALSLLLGERSDARAVTDKNAKSIIEAVFTQVDIRMLDLLMENSLDWNEGEIIVRREISPTGRSRAFINDTPVTLPVLRAVTLRLVDIHSQHANSLLSDNESQMGMIDSYCGAGELLEDYRRDFKKYVHLRNEIRRIRSEAERARENQEFIRFQLEQLDKLNPKEGELERIEKEFDLLSDADEIRERLSGAYNFLEGSEGNVLASISEVISLAEGVNLDLFQDDTADGGDMLSRLSSVKVELKDISETFRGWVDSVDADPVRLAAVTERMNALYDANRKFKISETDGLVRLREELRRQMNVLEGTSEDVEELENEARLTGRRLKEKANRLSEARREGALAFAGELNELARPLGLKNLRFEVDITSGKLTSTGQDSVEFICAFNKNQIMMPVSRVASGGEVSRLMLCIKRIMAGKMNLPTVIFDEIDTGVSGEIADRMGGMMAAMSAGMQVLAITHLPQVASKGDSHYKVYKADSGERTLTNVRRLSSSERIEEIAAMLSGAAINDAALQNARILLGDNIGNDGIKNRINGKE